MAPMDIMNEQTTQPYWVSKTLVGDQIDHSLRLVSHTKMREAALPTSTPEKCLSSLISICNHIYWAFAMCRVPCKTLWEDSRKGRERLTGRSLHFKNPRQIAREPKQTQDQNLQNKPQLH